MSKEYQLYSKSTFFQISMWELNLLQIFYSHPPKSISSCFIPFSGFQSRASGGANIKQIISRTLREIQDRIPGLQQMKSTQKLQPLTPIKKPIGNKSVEVFPCVLRPHNCRSPHLLQLYKERVSTIASKYWSLEQYLILLS